MKLNSILLALLIVLSLAAIGAGTYLYISQVAKPKFVPVVQKPNGKPVEVASTAQDVATTTKSQLAVDSTPIVATDTSDLKFIEPQTKEQAEKVGIIDNDRLLNKMFPNFKFSGGIAEFPEKSGRIQPDDHLLLKEVREDSFAKIGEKERLFLVMKEPAAHAEGFFHAWLGLFDRDGNLLTVPSVFPETNGSYCDSCPETYIAEKDNGFVADDGTFAYYECKGIKYILFVGKYQPNGGVCGSDGAIVMKFGNGRFETVQKITAEILENNPVVGVAETKYKYGINIIPADNKIMINRINIVPQSEDIFSPCEGSLYKTLNWNKETCRFE